MMFNKIFSRREWLQNTTTAMIGAAFYSNVATVSPAVETQSAQPKKKTKFQLACMTLPYSQFPLNRALSDIKKAGYNYVAWGTSHREKEGANASLFWHLIHR